MAGEGTDRFVLIFSLLEFDGGLDRPVDIPKMPSIPEKSNPHSLPFSFSELVIFVCVISLTFPFLLMLKYSSAEEESYQKKKNRIVYCESGALANKSNSIQVGRLKFIYFFKN